MTAESRNAEHSEPDQRSRTLLICGLTPTTVLYSMIWVLGPRTATFTNASGSAGPCPAHVLRHQLSRGPRAKALLSTRFVDPYLDLESDCEELPSSRPVSADASVAVSQLQRSSSEYRTCKEFPQTKNCTSLYHNATRAVPLPRTDETSSSYLAKTRLTGRIVQTAARQANVLA